jgi:protein-tyrosine-phosphatase
MGEAILKRLVANRPGAGEWRIESAGTWAEAGNPPTSYSQVVMLKQGMDISKHRSQPIDEDLISQFDIILTMESNHKEALQFVFKQYSDRIFMISEMAGMVEDISDPIGGDYEDYLETAGKIEQMFSAGLDRMVQLASTRSENHLNHTAVQDEAG